MRKMSEMPYHIGLKVKIYPSDRQKYIIATNDAVKRATYNHLVACEREKYYLSKTCDYVPVYRDRIAYLESVTKTAKCIKNKLIFLYEKEVDGQAILNAMKNYRNAWKRQKEQYHGIPIFKKKSNEQSYQTNGHYYLNKKGTLTSTARFEDEHHVKLPKLGRIRFSGSSKRVKGLFERTADTRIGTVTIKKDAVGEYWASFSIASEEPFYDMFSKTNTMHGIDLNLIDLVNTSDGESAINKRFYQNAQKKLAKEQKKLSRRNEHAKKDKKQLSNCKNYQQQRQKVAYLHRKIERQRKDYLHQLSKHEIESQDFIVAEDLKVRNLKKNHCLAKAISDAGWRKFLTMLQYKAEFYGKMVVLVPPQYTTQTCSICGYVMKGEEHLTLKDREWTCPNCHAHHDRDTNAAQNILLKGLQKCSDNFIE